MLVSAIMPTANRPEWVRKAVECFLAQTWAEKQLVILDDGALPSSESISGDPQIKYFVRGKVQPLGAKRNELCSLSWPAEIIIHWDDDDWSDPHRMERQVNRLLTAHHGGGKQVSGFHSAFFFDERTGKAHRWEHQGLKPYALGASLCYFREWQRANPFPPKKAYAEDHEFVKAAKAARALDSMEGGGLLVARRHKQSTSKTALGGKSFPATPMSGLPEGFLRATGILNSEF